MPTKKKAKTAKAKAAAPQGYAPPALFDGPIADKRAQFKRFTQQAPTERKSLEAFLSAKMATLTSHKGVNKSDRAAGVAAMEATLSAAGINAASLKKAPPVPGGVGYGMFYTAAFRTAFSRGTSLYYEIACPTPPGGNVNTWLYLTSTNRAQKGVEAFVSYQGQSDTRFKVFDWARPDQWQTNIPFSQLGPYLRNQISHGLPFQILPVWNSTYEIAAGRWRNEVLLYNRAAARWDLIYRFDYNSTPAEQIAGWVGSWGPIVETFQPTYSGTNLMGSLHTMLIARNAAGDWGSWGVLTAAQSTIRNDGLGFVPAFLDPNYSFVVKS